MKNKRIIVILLLSILIIPFVINADNYMSGDIDGNNIIASIDYILVKKHILQLSLLQGDQIKRADINNDNNINTSDYIMIKKIILGYDVTIPVTSVTLNKTDINLDVGKTESLTATITPSNAKNKNVTFSSSDNNIATVDQNGLVTAKKGGTATITVKTSDGEKAATCTITIKSKSDPIVPTSIYKQYESNTLKWYIRKTTYYYLTYIWMEDPYNQIKKLEANTAAYGKIYTDDELNKAGLSPVRRDVGQMMNAYISNGMIDINKSAIGYNGSAFYVNGAWDPPIPFYHNRADSWIDLQDGILTRARFDDGVNTHAEILGIDKNGNLIDYGNSVTKAEREAFYKRITNDKAKNTWTSTPILIKNGTNISYESDAANRQAICQIDSNNYVMLTTIYGMGLHQVGKVFSDLGCINAYNLDGGGSTSFFYKMNGDRSAKQIKCSDGKDRNVCRTIIEGIYFTEK